MDAFQLSYDYRCPFAKNLHLHVVAALRDGADFDVTFVPWTMSQGPDTEGLDVWDDPQHDGDLLALALSVAVRDEQPEHFLDVHEALFRARHGGANRLRDEGDLARALEGCSLDFNAALDDVRTRRPHQVIAESYRTFEHYEAFGVPTMVVGDHAVFVRYMRPPDDPASSRALIGRLVATARDDADLNEFKHTTVPY